MGQEHLVARPAALPYQTYLTKIKHKKSNHLVLATTMRWAHQARCELGCARMNFDGFIHFDPYFVEGFYNIQTPYTVVSKQEKVEDREYKE